MPSLTEMGLPTHQHLVIPAFRAVEEAGGSAKSREIVDHVVENYPKSENLVTITYPNRKDKSVLVDRAEWGRSTAKRIGALEQPSRGIYISTSLGKELLALPEEAAFRRVLDLDREYSRNTRKASLRARDTLVSP